LFGVNDTNKKAEACQICNLSNLAKTSAENYAKAIFTRHVLWRQLQKNKKQQRHFSKNKNTN